MSNLSLFEIIIKRENEWSHEEQEEIFSSMKKLIKIPLPCKVPIFCCFCSRYYFMFAFLWTTGTCTGEESQEDEGKTYDSIFPFIQHCILSICTLPIPIDAYSRLLISSYPPPPSLHLKKRRERNVKYLIKMRWLKNGKLLCFSFSFFFFLLLSVIDFCAKNSPPSFILLLRI